MDKQIISNMTPVSKNICLLCLSKVDSEANSSPVLNNDEENAGNADQIAADEVGASQSNGNEEAQPKFTFPEIAELCELVTLHNRTENSRTHQNILAQYQDGQCSVLCKECSVVTKYAQKARLQALKLENDFKNQIFEIRNKILSSDPKCSQLNSDEIEIDKFVQIRQSILCLSDEDDICLSSNNVQVNVKIETEDDVEFDPDNNINNHCPPSPSSYLMHLDGKRNHDLLNNKEEEDSDCPVFINPERRRSRRNHNSHRQSSKTDTNTTSAPSSEMEENMSLLETDQQQQPTTQLPQSGGVPLINSKDNTPSEPPENQSTSYGQQQSNIKTENNPSFDPELDSSSEYSELDPAAETEVEEDYDDEPLEDDDKDESDELSDSEIKDESSSTRNDDRRAHKCTSCSSAFFTKEGLITHVQRMHKFGCQICNKKFRTRRIRNNHEKNDHMDVGQFACTLCRRKFSRKGSLQAHMVMKHEDATNKPFSCTTCGKTFTLEINLNRHIDLHKYETERPFVCQLCDSRFVDDVRLERHKSTHNKFYVCNQCNRSYTSSSGLARHQRIHTGERPFPCEFPNCGLRFIDKARKQWHIAKVHGDPETRKTHVCEVCNKAFINVYILKAHMDRHQGKHIISCELCGDKFNEPSSLKTHKIIKHDGEALICDECGAKYMTMKGLKQHKMSHGARDEYPHKCDICEARFISKWVLNNHSRTHTGHRPFVCEHCGKAFKAKKHLDTHIKSIHSDDYVIPTPFPCTYCGKAFPRRTILEGHVRQVHTMERPHVCSVCSKGFALKSTLNLHLKSHGINTSVSGQRLPRSKRENFSSPQPPPRKRGKAAQRERESNLVDHSASSSSALPSTSSFGLPNNMIDRIDQSPSSTSSSSYGYAPPYHQKQMPHNFTGNGNIPLPDSGISGNHHHSNNPQLNSFLQTALSHFYQM